MVQVTTGVGEYVATERHAAAIPRRWSYSQARRGAVHCPGNTGTGIAHLTWPNHTQSYAIAQSGVPICGFDLGNRREWGNDTAISRVGSAWTFLKSRYGAKTDKVLLSGTSMGALGALNWARQNKSSVAAVALRIPVVNLADVHDNNRGGFQTEINTAYTNLAGYTAALPTHNPTAFAAELEGIPIRLYYSNDDTTVVASTVTAFAALIDSAEAFSFGAVGHTVDGFDDSLIVDFLNEYAD